MAGDDDSNKPLSGSITVGGSSWASQPSLANGPSDIRHIPVQLSSFGYGTQVVLTGNKEIRGLPTQLTLTDNKVKNQITGDVPTAFNYAEGELTLSPKKGMLGTIYSWFTREDDQNYQAPSTTGISYGAYAETKPFALNKQDNLTAGAGFRKGTLYPETSEVYAHLDHALTPDKTLGLDAGVLGHPGAFVGGSYNDPKMSAALRQYFYERRPGDESGYYNDTLQMALTQQVNSKTSLNEQVIYDETMRRLRQVSIGADHEFNKTTSINAQLGVFNSPDSPNRALQPSASITLTKKI